MAARAALRSDHTVLGTCGAAAPLGVDGTAPRDCVFRAVHDAVRIFIGHVANNNAHGALIDASIRGRSYSFPHSVLQAVPLVAGIPPTHGFNR